MKKGFLKNLKNPKWRYGGFSVLAMALLIAVAVLVSLGTDLMENKYGWRRDYSFNGLSTQSEVTRSVVNALPYPVHIYALYIAGQEDRSLMELLNRYQASSGLITYEMLELNKNPGLLSKFKGSTETSLTADSLIVNCEKTGRYKILSPESFYSLGYSLEVGDYEVELAYEKQITEALLYVTRDEIPEIMLLSGNNELTGDDVSTLKDVLTSNNYNVRTVNLRNGDTLTPGALLMILSPTEDLRPSELDAITSFAKAGGAIFFTCDFTDDLSQMPNYTALLRSYGMKPLSGVVVSSTEEPNTYYDSQAFLIPYMLSTPPTASLLSTGLDQLVIPGARAFETPETTDVGLTVSPVLASGYQAYLKNDSSQGYDQQEGDPIGPFSVALLSQRTQADGTLSRAFMLGSSQLITNSQMYSITSNHNLELMLRICEYLLGQEHISLDIVLKPSVRPALSPSVLGAGTVTAAGLPLAVLVLAIFVLMPRRHR